MLKSEIRKAYFLNKYAIITPSRENRPRFITEKTIEKKQADCVFCPDNISGENAVKLYGRRRCGWQLAVLKNKYPSVTLDNPKAYGIQEVIIETPLHDTEFDDLGLGAIELYLKVLRERLLIISENKKIEYILQFKNDGSKAGATVKHAHSQIFATAILPYDVREELMLAEEYKNNNGNCPYCDILRDELAGKRSIYEDTHIGAFTPYASEYHYESWIFPKRHTDNISTLRPGELKSLAKCLKFILNKVKALGLSYNFFMHQVVSRRDQHFYVKIQPRDANVWAGVELGSGLVINSVSPEKAAAYFKGRPWAQLKKTNNLL